MFPKVTPDRGLILEVQLCVCVRGGGGCVGVCVCVGRLAVKWNIFKLQYIGLVEWGFTPCRHRSNAIFRARSLHAHINIMEEYTTKSGTLILYRI